MTRGRFLTALALAALPLAAAQAAGLTVAKTQTVVADQVNILNPKALPGATVDYAITVTNPNGALSGQAIAAVAIVDAIPAKTVLRVADYGAAGSGPIEFADGNLLGLGLSGSGLSYGFAGLASTTDSVDFSVDGVTWTYTPVADANGYDSRVRAVRIRLSGTQTASTSFRLRFRVRVS